HERGRAGALDVDAGAGEVELERHARREEVAVVADVAEVAGLAAELRIVETDHVARHEAARARVHADHARSPRRVESRVLERLPGNLEEQAVLRIHEAGLARGVTEERRVELVVPRQGRRPPPLPPGGHAPPLPPP